LYSSPNIIRLIISRRVKWAGYVSHVREERKVYRILVGKPESQKERDCLEDQGVGGKMGSEWIIGRLNGGVWSGSSWLRVGTGGELF
jgi:hypothetical protein